MPSAVYRDPEYVAMKQRLMAGDEDCEMRLHRCTGRATVPNHAPPLSEFGGSLHAWRSAGGMLVPSCEPCNKLDGGRAGAAKTNARKAFAKNKPARRSAVVYPGSRW